MQNTRRNFLKTLGTGAAGVLMGCGASPPRRRNPAPAARPPAAPVSARRPNIVLVIADQLRHQSCGYAGDSLARTPRMDALSAAGVDFAQAVSSMPVCSAFRASLMTGKYTSSTGMVINELRMNTSHATLAGSLTAAGYETGYIGKWHLYANELGNHSAPRNSFVPRGPDRLGFDGYWAGYNFHHDYYGENAYYHTESPEKIHFPSGVYEPDGQTDLAIDYLKRAAGREKPFFLVLSLGTPHDPWSRGNVPPEYYAQFQDTEFPLPRNYSETLDPYGDAWSNMPRDRKRLNEWMRVYYAMTANLDHNLGRLLDATDEVGIGGETLFVFTSDHGEMFGAHGRMKKNIFYEEAARVPLLMRWPGRIPSGQVSEACANTVDILPTLLSLAGVPVPEGVEGMDLSAAAQGRKGPEPRFAFLMNTGACAAWEDGHEWRALRTPEYAYAVYRGWEKKGLPRREILFDLGKDPLQMRDLAGDPAQADRLGGFRKELAAKMASLNDTFPASTWYRDHWIENRIIQRTATLP